MSFLCPRRSELPPQAVLPESDHWRNDRTCSHCGSMKPEALFEAIKNGKRLDPTDKSYKVYVSGSDKFYFQHFNDEERALFCEMLNEKVLNLGAPGYFYVLPYFLRVAD